MTVVTIQTAKIHLSHLLRRVEAGEEIVISRGDTPVARLVPIESVAPTGLVSGAARGHYAAPPPDASAPMDGTELKT